MWFKTIGAKNRIRINSLIRNINWNSETIGIIENYLKTNWVKGITWNYHWKLKKGHYLSEKS
jgi:hypothetical protein